MCFPNEQMLIHLDVKGEIKVAIKDLKSNFKIIKLSKNIPPKRKQFLLNKILYEIELLFFEDSEVNEQDKQYAGKLYKDIQTYLHLFQMYHLLNKT